MDDTVVARMPRKTVLDGNFIAGNAAKRCGRKHGIMKWRLWMSRESRASLFADQNAQRRLKEYPNQSVIRGV